MQHVNYMREVDIGKKKLAAIFTCSRIGLVKGFGLNNSSLADTLSTLMVSGIRKDIGTAEEKKILRVESFALPGLCSMAGNRSFFV